MLSRTTLRKCGNRVLQTPSVPFSRQSRPCMSAISAISRRSVSVVTTPASMSKQTHGLFVTSDVIAGEVLAKIYRVSRANVIPSRTLREQLYHRLTQWSLELPDHLNYKFSSSQRCPAPHILAMHIQYWAIVLLMHRPLCVLHDSHFYVFWSIDVSPQYPKRLRVSW